MAQSPPKQNRKWPTISLYGIRHAIPCAEPRSGASLGTSAVSVTNSYPTMHRVTTSSSKQMASAGIVSENSCVNEEIADDVDDARLVKRPKFHSQHRYKGTSGKKRANQAREARERLSSKNAPAVRAEPDDSAVIHPDSDSDRTVDYDVNDYIERTAQLQGSRSRVKLSLMGGTAAPQQQGLAADNSTSDTDGK